MRLAYRLYFNNPLFNSSFLVSFLSHDLNQDLFGCFLLVSNSLSSSFSGSSVVLGLLPPNRKPLSVPQTPIATNVHQPFDVQLNLRLQNTLSPKLFCYNIPDGGRLIVIPLTSLFVKGNSRLGQNCPGRTPSYTKNIGQADLSAFIVRNVNTCNSSHN